MADSRYRLDIVANYESEHLPEQVELIRSSGAAYDAVTRTFYLWLDDAWTSEDPVINLLFRAAREHGTHVVVRKVG